MCDAISTSIIFGALSLLPGNRYVTLALILAMLTIYTILRQYPSHKLEILGHAQANCARSHVDLMDGMRRLLEAKLSASKIQTRLLETRSVTTWEEFCAKKVKEVHRSALLTIEAERQRQLSEGIKEVREIHETVIRSPAAPRPTYYTHGSSSP
ncbi:hypothetical protein B0H14DRAFT_3491260 [Mycena olivaceomarginata]|nr:hypothetical protein B0H14DRAFT_3491260 [Mycena olivaceomarginata]